ncbi:MAG: TonB-dependent receptor [Christiangramia sp.]|uniref:TonB-dependent receptor domain-containing protein n=1 Tax=Christiangramia sp. TaxID=1931228 RepID=UPI0032420B2A
MKRTLLILLFFAYSISQAQELSITGSVKDDSNQPLAGATILLKTIENDTLIKATISNIEGVFLMENLKLNSYKLEISSIGYAKFEKQFELKKTTNLGEISMTQSEETLDEVLVEAEKPIVQVLADKTVFNVENTLNTTGTNAFELLRKAPGVLIDNSGGIIVEGKAGVQIYINDKPSVLRGDDLQSFLKGLQADDIASLEIITQPSSKYDAAGNAGIINIKLKKNKSLGTNGNMNSSLTIGDYARINNGLSFNNREKGHNLYGSYSNRFGKSTNYLYLLRQQNGIEFDAKTNSIFDSNSNNFRIGYDFFASDKSTIGAIVQTNFNNFFSDNNSRTPIRQIGETSFDSILIANNRSHTISKNLSTNLNYRYSDTLGRSLNIDLDYGKYDRDGNAFQPNIYYGSDEMEILNQNITRQLTPTNIDVWTAKTDFETNFLNGKLASGFKFSNVVTDNNFQFYDIENSVESLNKDRSNRFEYRENINAGYINFNKKWTKWSFQGGLRVEQTISEGNLRSVQNNQNQTVKRNYTNLFPSGGFTYQLNRINQFAINYSRRIERPNYQSLNPFEYKIDELSYRRGNPFLQPQYTNNFKLSHTYKYKFTTSLSYSHVSDFFAQITEAEGERRNYIMERNIANQKVWNLGISWPFKLQEWWNVYVSLNGSTNSYKSDNPDFQPISQETLSFYAQNTIALPAEISMEISGWYSSPTVWGGTYQTKALGSLNLAFQKKFLDENLSAKIAMNDILYTAPWRGNTRYGNLYIQGQGGSDSRNIVFSLSYNFGSQQIKKARDRKTGLEDESSRIQ